MVSPAVIQRITWDRDQKERSNFFKLFHMDSFGRTCVNAGLAVHTHVLVHLRLLVLHGYGGRRAFTHAGLASGTLGHINNCYQRVHSIVIMGKR